MESPGKFLKRERETRSISLEQISNFTKIKEHHLKAIEEDRYELLPAVLYVKGYLTGYARYLALDPKDIVQQYEKYLKSLIPPEPVKLEPEPPPKKKVKPWFLFSLATVVVLSATWVIIYSAHRSPEKKLEAASLPLISLSPAIQSEIATRPIHRAQQNQAFDFPQGLLKIDTEPLLSLSPEGPVLSSTPSQAEIVPLRYQLSGPERATAAAGKEERPALKVVEAGIGTGVERDGAQQSLIGKCSALRSNNQRGYFFTRIKTQKGGKIAHIWLREGKEYYRIEIDVKPPAWSVYSYFTFRPQHTGNWKAEARDRDHILTSLNFNVVQPSEDRSL